MGGGSPILRAMRTPIIVAALILALSTSRVATAAEANCSHSRECLADVMSAYLQALTQHDPATLPMTRNVKYTENGVRIAIGDGLWQTAAAMPTYRLDIIDEEAGQVGLLGRISENGNNNWYAVRLKVEPDRKVSQIEALINRSISGPGGGGPPSGARQAPTEPHPLMAQVIPASKRASRADLAKAGDAYFTGLDTEESGANVPF